MNKKNIKEAKYEWIDFWVVPAEKSYKSLHYPTSGIFLKSAMLQAMNIWTKKTSKKHRSITPQKTLDFLAELNEQKNLNWRVLEAIYYRNSDSKILNTIYEVRLPYKEYERLGKPKRFTLRVSRKPTTSVVG